MLQICEADLSVIGRVLRAANSLVQEEFTPHSRTRTWQGTFPPPPGAPGGGMGSMIEEFIEDQVNVGLGEVMDLMQQHMRQMFGDQEGVGGSRESGDGQEPDALPDRRQVGDDRRCVAWLTRHSKHARSL